MADAIRFLKAGRRSRLPLAASSAGGATTGSFRFSAPGYCVSTVGLDEAKIRQYIREQEEEERRQEVLLFGLEPPAQVNWGVAPFMPQGAFMSHPLCGWSITWDATAPLARHTRSGIVAWPIGRRARRGVGPMLVASCGGAQRAAARPRLGVAPTEATRAWPTCRRASVCQGARGPQRRRPTRCGRRARGHRDGARRDDARRDDAPLDDAHRDDARTATATTPKAKTPATLPPSTMATATTPATRPASMRATRQPHRRRAMRRRPTRRGRGHLVSADRRCGSHACCGGLTTA